MDKDGYEVELVFQGQIIANWSEYIESTHLVIEPHCTQITGMVIDQSALFGLVKRIRDSGHQVIKFNCQLIKGDEPKGTKK